MFDVAHNKLATCLQHCSLDFTIRWLLAEDRKIRWLRTRPMANARNGRTGSSFFVQTNQRW
jgi:hypothetical protein